MKAEPDPHHEEGYVPTPVESEERPEAAIGRKVEKLAKRPRKSAPSAAPRPEREPEAHVEPEAPRKPASVGKSGAQGDTDDLG